MPTIYKYYIGVLFTMLVLFICAFFIAQGQGEVRRNCYEESEIAFQSGNFSEAKEGFEELGNYRDSSTYLLVIDLCDEGQYVAAMEMLSTIDGDDIPYNLKLLAGQQMYYAKDFLSAQALFSEVVSELNRIENFSKDYIAAKDWLEKTNYAYAQRLYEASRYEDVIDFLSKVEMTDKLSYLLNLSKYKLAQKLFNENCYSTAVNLFEELSKISELNSSEEFEDLSDWLVQSKYAYAEELYESNNFDAALSIFLTIDSYKKSAQYTDNILNMDINISDDVLYQAADRHFQAGMYWQALSEFRRIKQYRDSADRISETLEALRRNLATTISVGLNYSVALKDDDSAIATEYYQGLSDVNRPEWHNLVSISGFSSFTVGLKFDGTVISTSKSINNSINADLWTDILAVSVGEAYVVGLKSNGTLIGAGHDLDDGQLDIDGWTNIIAIATGWRHTVGLDTSGNVFITGYGSSFQLNQIQKDKDSWSDIIAIAAGGGSNGAPGGGHTVGLRKDGKVVAVGDNDYNQCDVEDWTDIVAIAAGDWFTVGLHSDGSIEITQPDPTKARKEGLYIGACKAKEWTGIVEIAAGGGSVVGLNKDGDANAAGYGEIDGQTAISNEWTDIKLYR